MAQPFSPSGFGDMTKNTTRTAEVGRNTVQRMPTILPTCPHCAEWSARFDRLVQQLVDLKRDGFVPPSAPAEAAPLPSLDAVIREAIRTVAGTTGPTARELERQAWQLVAEGKEPTEIARLIVQGEEVTL